MLLYNKYSIHTLYQYFGGIIMWKDLSKEWQLTFEQGWIAYQNGNIPIGAIITDQKENVLISGHNKTRENTYPNPRTAHAEHYCMVNLDTTKYRETGDYILYTTMEPCPMCMGTIVMGGIRNIMVAARDSYCGALHYAKTDPFMKRKNLNITVTAGEMEAVQLAQQSYFELKTFKGDYNFVLEQFNSTNPKSVSAAQKMYEESYLDYCVENSIPYGEIYDHICELINE